MLVYCPKCNSPRHFKQTADVPKVGEFLSCTSCDTKLELVVYQPTPQAPQVIQDNRSEEQKLADASSYAEMERRNAQLAGGEVPKPATPEPSVNAPQVPEGVPPDGVPVVPEPETPTTPAAPEPEETSVAPTA